MHWDSHTICGPRCRTGECLGRRWLGSHPPLPKGGVALQEEVEEGVEEGSFVGAVVGLGGGEESLDFFGCEGAVSGWWVGWEEDAGWEVVGVAADVGVSEGGGEGDA